MTQILPPIAVTPVHTAVLGRARLRVRGLRQSPAIKQSLERRLRTATNIRSLSASTLTGTVLVEFDPAVALADIVARIETVLRHPYEATAAGRRDDEPAWHRMSVGRAADQLGGSARAGLNDGEARRRLAKLGENRIPPPQLRAGLAILAEQLTSLPVGLLAAAAVLSVASGGLLDAAVILSVVGLNAAIGYVTESRAERTIGTLRLPSDPMARVVRDGRMREIAATGIVPGDLLVLERDRVVCADARVVSARELSVSEAALTGESAPVHKRVGTLAAIDAALADRSNMVYRGTVVTGGSGLALVTTTGRKTELGRIQALAASERAPETPLQRELDRLGSQLVWLSLGVCALVFVLGLLRGNRLLQMLKSAISLAVAAVPEGLPTLATTTLALGIEAMRRHKVLVRELAAIETLAAVRVICFDKTGTLTQNRMSAVALVAGAERWQAGRPLTLRPDGKRLLEICALCNDAELEQARRVVRNGSPTEGALLELAIEAGIDVAGLRAAHPTLRISRRTERRQFVVSQHQMPSGEMLVAMKGNPLEVLQRCNRRFADGGIAPLSADMRAEIVRLNAAFADRALRVLGVAYDERGSTPGRATADRLVWVGLIGLADPARAGTVELMRRFHRAGIRTVMITGDQAATARAIAEQLGLSGSAPPEIVDARRLAILTGVALADAARRAHVFARVSPSQKLLVVRALQRAGQVIAMTGDGINDSPALRAADIGIAMGRSGADAARDFAKIVLETDELVAIAIAVEHGRNTYGNIRKAIRYLLATNLSEILVMLVLTATGIGPPLSPIQLLWINLLTDVLPGLGLALEPPASDVMEEPPRPADEPLVRWSDSSVLLREAAVISGGALAAYAYGLARYGRSPQTGTLTFGALVMAQLLHALTSRSPTHGLFRGGRLPPNRALLGALAITAGAQALAFLAPPLRRLLGLSPIGWVDAAIGLMAGSLPFLLNEALKPPAAEPPPSD